MAILRPALLSTLLLVIHVVTLVLCRNIDTRRLPSSSSGTGTATVVDDFDERANRDAMMLFDDVDKSGNRRGVAPLASPSSVATLVINEMNALATFYNALQGQAWLWQKDTQRYGMHWNFAKSTQNVYLHDPCREVWQGLYCSCNYSASSYSRTVNINYYYYDYADLADTSYCNIVKIALIGFKLNGTLPDDVFGNFPRLTHLHLALNKGIRGNLSSFCGLTSNMTKFSIFNNSMGPAPVVPPPCFSKFTRLFELDLGYNPLQGTIGSSIGSLSSLVALYLDNSSLAGSLPSSLGDLAELGKVQVDQNSLTSSIPSSLGKLKRLFKLLLYNNSLSSTLPSQLGDASHLVTINFGFNRLSGSLPSTFGNFFFLQQLTMTSNSLTSSVPLNILKLHFLQKLDLSYNSLTGSLPIMYSYEISEIVLDHNHFTGKLGGMLFHVPLLVTVSLSHNSFSGQLPEEYWSSLPKLSRLLLAHNAFTGTLPEGLAALSNLLTLDLRGNALVSTIPQSYTQSLIVLHSLLLDDNNIGPTVPDYIGDFYSLSNTSLRNCKISGSLPPRKHKIPIQLLDLSQNPGLDGQLPDAFCDNVLNLNSPLTLNFSGTSFSCLPACLSRFYPLLTFSYDANTPFCTSAPTSSPTPKTEAMLLDRTATIEVAVLAVFFGSIILSYSLYELIKYWRNNAREEADERETDVYLMHSASNQSTHEFVKSVCDELEKRGIAVWFDNERDVKKNFVRHRKIYAGLTNTKVVCAMITEDYKTIVDRSANTDDLSREFSYAVEQKKPTFMLPVLLDGKLENSREWKGALGGTLGTHLYFRLVKEDEDFDLSRKEKFDKLAEAIHGIKGNDFFHSSDVFLSHNWGPHPAHENHQRVDAVNTFLSSRSIKTWFDGEKMKGDLRFVMRHGIENTKIFCVFITDAYKNKISGRDELDNCHYEFKYAIAHVKHRNILPIVMEAKYKEKTAWTGSLNILTDLDSVDLSSTDSVEFQAGCEKLHERIKVMLDRYALVARVTSVALPTSSSAASSTLSFSSNASSSSTNQKKKTNSLTAGGVDSDVEAGVSSEETIRHSIQVFGRSSTTSTSSTKSGGRRSAGSVGGAGGGDEQGVAMVPSKARTTSSFSLSPNAIAITNTTQNPLAIASSASSSTSTVATNQQAVLPPAAAAASPSASSSSTTSMRI